MELIVAVVVVGILAAVAMPSYSNAKEQALDKEARANLGLLQAAERVVRMETSAYYPTSGSQSSPSSINTNLRVQLTETNWDYTVYSTGRATAVRTGGPRPRTWELLINSTQPTCSGTCFN